MAKTNRVDLTERDYKGAESTMCRGCGHDAISASIMRAFFASSVDPRNVIKLSGIGCSSKTPNYFMNQAFGINAVHGRMSAVATGANVANHQMVPLGISGDGDTSAIGLGNFCHMMRRNVNITYVIENNGVYGLTKGQFSATADEGTVMKGGKINDMPAIDLCELAITLGATYIGRSFSGDRKQLAPLIQGAVAHKGTAILDVLSPCVTFNDHHGSTKSLKYIREHLDPLHDIDFIPPLENIEADYEEGTDQEVTMHDGSRITLHKLGHNYDPTNRMQAVTALHAAVGRAQVSDRPDLSERRTAAVHRGSQPWRHAAGLSRSGRGAAVAGSPRPDQRRADEIARPRCGAIRVPNRVPSARRRRRCAGAGPTRYARIWRCTRTNPRVPGSTDVHGQTCVCPDLQMYTDKPACARIYRCRGGFQTRPCPHGCTV